MLLLIFIFQLVSFSTVFADSPFLKKGFYTVDQDCSKKIGKMVYYDSSSSQTNLITQAGKVSVPIQLNDSENATFEWQDSSCVIKFASEESDVLGIQSKFYAHRGTIGEYPANTLPAFDSALDQGFSGFEFDIRISKDGKIVVSHDDELRGSTNCKGKISKMIASEIIERCHVLRSNLIPNLRIFSQKSKKLASMPLLEEVFLRYLPQSRVKRIFVDIKQAGQGLRLIAALKSSLSQLENESMYQEKIAFISTSLTDIQLLREYFPRALVFFEEPNVFSGVLDQTTKNYWNNSNYDGLSIFYSAQYDPSIRFARLLMFKSLKLKSNFLNFYEKNQRQEQPKLLLGWIVAQKKSIVDLRKFSIPFILTDYRYDRLIEMILRTQNL